MPSLAQTPPPPRPNFVIFIADDLGWNDVQYHGSPIRTPNIDAMAGRGVELNRFYVYPTCSPTRAALLTGRAPSRWGILGPIAGGDNSSIPHPHETLPELLHRGGYQTALVGKWHLGILPADIPNKHGFDYSYGALHGQVDPLTHAYKYGDKTWQRNGEFISEEGHATDLIAADAVRWLGSDRKADAPFFLYVAFTVPHYPLSESPEWMAPYLPKTGEPTGREAYEAATTHMDDAIGRVIAALREKGQLDNTVLLFMSDNGAQDLWMAPAREYDGRYKPSHRFGDNTPLRGWKAGVYEGGIRVPAVLSWPGHLEPGKIDAPIRTEDILPTFAKLAGVAIDPAMNYEGIDAWPVLTKAQPGPDRTIYVHHLADYALIKDGWKMILPGGPQSGRPAELYDLKHDPNETKNLAGFDRPRVAAMRTVLEQEASKDSTPITAPVDVQQ